METINTKYANFLNALNAFEKTINVFNKKKYEYEEDEYNAMVGGVIHHFEMVYEATWKFLKAFLAEKGIEDLNSPKAIFQACYKFQILSEEITLDLIAFIDDRNRTTHTYNQELAIDVCNSIMKRYNAFDEVKRVIEFDN